MIRAPDSRGCHRQLVGACLGRARSGRRSSTKGWENVSTACGTLNGGYAHSYGCKQRKTENMGLWQHATDGDFILAAATRPAMASSARANIIQHQHLEQNRLKPI